MGACDGHARDGTDVQNGWNAAGMPTPTPTYYFRADAGKDAELAESEETVVTAWNLIQSQAKGQLDAARAALTLGRELQEKGKLQ